MCYSAGIDRSGVKKDQFCKISRGKHRVKSLPCSYIRYVHGSIHPSLIYPVFLQSQS